MPATPRGFPYPTPDDPVSLGASDIRALAEALDAYPALGFFYSIEAGVVRTLSALYVSGTVAVDMDDTGDRLQFGSPGDAQLWRSAAAMLEANSGLTVGGVLYVNQHAHAMNGYWKAVGGVGFQQKMLAAPSTAVDYQLIGGASLVTTDASGNARIAWGLTAAAVLSVLACNGDEAVALGVQVGVHQIDTAGFSIHATPPAGGTWQGAPVRVSWQALIQL
jgi:hypothetical protein